MAKRKWRVITKSWCWLCLSLLTFFAFSFVVACDGDIGQQSSTGSSPPECRTIQHQLGETCVPTNPQRIVAADFIALEILLALGLKPIAAADTSIKGTPPRHLAGKVDDIVSLGNRFQLNLERTLQLNPDLILGDGSILEKNYNEFSQIAPTVVLDYFYFKNHNAWKSTLQRAGEALSRSQQAQQQLEKYQDRVEKLRRVMGDHLDQTEVSLARFNNRSVMGFRDRSSFPGSVLEDVGLPRPPAQRKTNSDSTFKSVSLERLDLLDGDVIFVLLGNDAKEPFAEFRKDPLWQKLEAVQNNRVFTVDFNYWSGGNVLAANAILDDLFEYLVQEEDNDDNQFSSFGRGN